MNKKILRYGGCLALFHGVCAPNAWEMLSEGGDEVAVDDWSPFGGYQIGHERLIEQLYLPTERNPEQLANFERDNLRRHEARLERLESDKKIMRARFDASEIFGPLSKEFNYKAVSWSMFSDLAHTLQGIWNDTGRINELLQLGKNAEKYSEGTGPIAKSLKELASDYALEGSLFRGGSRFEKILYTVVEYLQEDNLTVYDRLWTLNILRILQSFLPRKYLEPIRQDPNTGRVCRGGLELFLTQGFDLVKYLSHGRKDTFTPDEPIAEALKRVELIWNIKNHLGDAARDHQTPIFIAIHDKLLLKRSLANGGLIESLTMKSLQHMNAEDTPDEEIKCLDLILKHLKAFYPSVKGIIDSLPSTSKPSHVFQERFKCQAKLQPHIQKYLEKRDMDPYIKSLLLPFLGWRSVNLDYIKNLLHSCNVQDSALKESKLGLRVTDVAKEEKYHEDQDFFIDMMYEVSSYFEGLQDHLDGQVKKDRKSGHYQFKTKLMFEKEDKSLDNCPICLDRFIKAQRVVQLRCHCSHILHENCASTLMIRSADGSGVKCPICRKSNKTPLAHSQHIFWGQLEDHQTMGGF